MALSLPAPGAGYAGRRAVEQTWVTGNNWGAQNAVPLRLFLLLTRRSIFLQRTANNFIKSYGSQSPPVKVRTILL